MARPKLEVADIIRRYGTAFRHTAHPSATARRVLHALEPLREPPAFQRFLAVLRKQEWVVYAKPPFADAGRTCSITSAVTRTE